MPIMNLPLTMTIEPMLAFSFPGGTEWLVILVVALLLFGRRLPDVARSVGKSIVEFKKGLRDVKDEINIDGELNSTSNRLEHRASPSSSASASAQTPSAKATQNDAE